MGEKRAADTDPGQKALGAELVAWWAVCGVLMPLDPQEESGLSQLAPGDSRKSLW